MGRKGKCRKGKEGKMKKILLAGFRGGEWTVRMIRGDHPYRN